MSMCRVFSCVVGRGWLLWPVHSNHQFSWQTSISFCPASFRIPRPNLPVTAGVSWLPTFAFQSPIWKGHLFWVVLEKAEEPEIKLPTSSGSWKKQESYRKTSISALLTIPKPLTVWITISYGKFWKRWEYQTTWPASWETCLLRNLQEAGQEATVRTGLGTTDWLQIGKGVYQGCILSLCLFNLHAEYIMRNTGLDDSQL